MRNQLVSWPLGSCLPQGSAFLPGPEPYSSALSIPPRTIAAPPGLSIFPTYPPPQTRTTFPTAQHSPGDHSICSRTSPSLQNHSTPLQGPQHPMKDQHHSGVTVKLLSPTNTPHPIGAHRHIPELFKGNLQPWSGQILEGQQVHGPRTWADRMPEGMARQGSVPGPRDGEQAARGGLWWWGCGNAASGSQQDLLGYTLNPPHKRGLFVRTGCWWLSHTCLASRAWRIKDNWFSPDRKYQEC